MRTSHTVLLGVVFCLALSSVFATGEVESFLERSTQSAFGRTLLGTIELEMNSDAPGDYLINLLNKMQQTLANDISTTTNTHNVFQTRCKNEHNQLKLEIRRHAQNVIESKELIKKASKTRAWNENQRETNRRMLAEAQANYGKISKIREAEAAEYTKKIKELNDALKVLHEGKNLIERNLKAPAFVEVANSFNSYVERMTREIVSDNYRGRGYVSVVSFIAELIQKAAVQANQGSVNRIIGAIQAIIDQLESTKTFETKAENERLDNFGQLKAIYDKSIEELKFQIQKLTNQIRSLKDTIRYNVNRVGENTRAIRVKGRQKRKLTKECTAEQRIFDKENKVRQANFNLLKEALGLINEHKDEFRSVVLAKAKTAIEARYGKGK